MQGFEAQYALAREVVTGMRPHLELMAKDYIVSFRSVRDLEALGVTRELRVARSSHDALLTRPAPLCFR